MNAEQNTPLTSRVHLCAVCWAAAFRPTTTAGWLVAVAALNSPAPHTPHSCVLWAGTAGAVMHKQGIGVCLLRRLLLL